MSSIYNEDITMSHKNNKQGLAALSTAIIAETVEDIANSLKNQLTGDERDMILEAVGRLARVDPANEMVSDWRNAALAATDERDRLRILVANRDAEIELLKHKINALERCVIQNALNTSRLAQRDQEETDDNIVFHAGRTVQREIDHERHTDADNIGKIINDLENGEF